MTDPIATGPDNPKWESAKFYVLLVSVGVYALCSAIAGLIWRTDIALASAGVQFVICVAVDFLLFFLYFKGNHQWLFLTNTLTIALILGAMFNVVYIGYLFGADSQWSNAGHVFEAVILLLASAWSIGIVIFHFIIVSKPGGPQYKPAVRKERAEFEARDPSEPAIQAPVMDLDP
jgi:hypothetical protein